MVLFGGTTKSKLLSWQDNTVTDCYIDYVGYISLITGSAIEKTIVMPGKVGDTIQEINWLGFPA